MLGLQLLRQGLHPPWGPKTSSGDGDQVEEHEKEVSEPVQEQEMGAVKEQEE